ncbi:hypothetical protein [Mycobacterium sp. 141]|uniref:hypothetical protein n=1 Tax=Mycobacterium sp. 141 TaxID=1120797 RepID=UPI0003614851|nr:hypothetical protein [Mycobacterium sp. 141]
MAASTSEPALTLAEAADRLEISTQRVNQLLDDGLLAGPEYLGRAPKGAPRVWARSLLDYERDHERGSVLSRSKLARALAERDAIIADLRSRLAAAESTTVEALRLELAAARAAALELSVGSDVLLEGAKQSHCELEELKTTLAAREAELAALRSRYELSNVALKSKSAALTQLLMPHTPPG